jgi:hypothetical protein
MAGYKHRVDASPFYKLPSPPTNPELIAAAMISEAHLKASPQGLSPSVRTPSERVRFLHP